MGLYKPLDSYAYTLAFSSLSYGLIFGLYMFVYSGFMAIALVTIGIIAFYALITYLVFAVPLQVWLRRRGKKFNLINLIIYTAVAFVAALSFFAVTNPTSALAVLKSINYYIMSIVAALIYWFWDSIFLH
ncbi:UPF0715 family protein [Bacillus spizizenii]|uniref:UPF0715 family protein n=1 Tax=Bacillus spizizenii TaxID=96241 RepID=UPI00227E8677|nr:UPF0715 family protein [Bacillus spizizenii]MCY8063874.1 UPF0715 family protein [Bacillus spizizenii]MCY8135344.1 UPF0715 family protein [Bacillus spizizenii]MCY8256920.1 UPF0715 family protein [Bacillus spizizenii]MCY8335556.1 UPF0715 family protein [Bacillus spizizenii]MCY8600333.1 UPF0715 family protein [Bacillus spizizenii]